MGTLISTTSFLARTGDLNQVVKLVHKVYGDFDFLFFDEVQNVEGWELFLNRLQRRGCNLIITGSNSRLLGRELATHLTVRCGDHDFALLF